MTNQRSNKGAGAEEALRHYFLSLGYYVVRSVPFCYRSFDVTDVDLWLYLRPSSITRERACVDIKRRKTPQAIERVFWSKGLQQVLRLEKCIVATTDNRKETRDFGALHEVTVLSGGFLQRVVTGFQSTQDRITEEAFLSELGYPCVIDSRINWRTFYRDSKQTLLLRLNFDGCNYLLDRSRHLIEECLATTFGVEASLRLLYIHLSFFLVSLDYTSRLITNHDPDTRKQVLADGFRYGEAGRDRTEEIVNTALHILSNANKADLLSRAALESEIKQQVAVYPAEVLSEYFAKAEVMKHLFDFAREFEAAAFAAKPQRPSEASSQMKAIMGLLCDFFKIDRKKLI